jgi:hypothetical protein
VYLLHKVMISRLFIILMPAHAPGPPSRHLMRPARERGRGGGSEREREREREDYLKTVKIFYLRRKYFIKLPDFFSFTRGLTLYPPLVKTLNFIL